MEIKIVKQPVQDEQTLRSITEHVEIVREYGKIFTVTPTWCVKTFIYREKDGGMNLWFDMLNEIEPDVVYLYEIKANNVKIVNGSDPMEWEDDILYSVRADIQKK